MYFKSWDSGYEPVVGNPDIPFFSAYLIQAPAEITKPFTVNSFDLSIALIGGYSALIWQLFGFLIGSYQEFKYNSELISHLCTEEKKQRPDHHIEEDDADEVIATIHNR